MKIKACDYLFPNQPVVNDNSFEMIFSIARHVPNALPLTSAADYAHLLSNASKIKTNPTVKVSLNSCAPNLVLVFGSPVRSGFLGLRGLDRDRDQSYHDQKPRQT